MKVACCVWRGAFGTGLLQQYLAGCLPYINKKLLSYCEQEQITFSRGRPHLKDDQGFVEQKNGAIVRQFVGFDRLAGYQASRQLRELYRALRLYVNCFQPSMKLVSKHDEGTTVRRVYDPAKTPLQRLLLSGILSATAQQHLREVMQALDPLLLLHHLECLQQAVWRGAHHASPRSQSIPAGSILHFKDPNARARDQRYQHLIDQTSESKEQKEPAEEHQSRERPGPHTRKRRRKRLSSAADKKGQGKECENLPTG